MSIERLSFELFWATWVCYLFRARRAKRQGDLCKHSKVESPKAETWLAVAAALPIKGKHEARSTSRHWDSVWCPSDLSVTTCTSRPSLHIQRLSHLARVPCSCPRHAYEGLLDRSEHDASIRNVSLSSNHSWARNSECRL